MTWPVVMKWAVAAMIAVAPVMAQAGWRSTTEGQTIAVVSDKMIVTVTGPWAISSGFTLGTNRSEHWTMDGYRLNDLAFFAGVENGKALYKWSNRDRPIPFFSSTMLAPDIVQLFESTVRITEDTSDFTVDTVAPARWLGVDGVSFAFHYIPSSDGLVRRGEGRAAVVDGKLYMAVFTATDIHYYQQGIGMARQVMDSARLPNGRR